MLGIADARTQISRLMLLEMVRDKSLSVHNELDIAGAGSVRLFVPPQSGDPMCLWRGPSIAFLHIEKTAGSSLTNLLTGLFHPFQIDPDPWRAAAPHVIPSFTDRPHASIRSYPLIFGHYDLPSLQQLDPDRLVVTMLREPVARILSIYYYWRSVHPDFIAKTTGENTIRIAHRMTLLEFLHHQDPLLLNYIDNLYVRRLTALYASADHDPLAETPDDALRKARASLERLAFVGVTEQMAASIRGLGARLGFNPPAEPPTTNMTKSNHLSSARAFRSVTHEVLTAAHHERLDHLTRLDRVLYAAACARLAG